jgi:chemotaxis protein MotB
MRSQLFLACTVAIALTAGSGCVSSNTHRQLADDHAQLNSSLDSLERANASLERENQELMLQLNSVETRNAEMENTYDSLVADLTHELESGSVEIQQLRDGIRLNVSQDVLFGSGSITLDERGREVIQKVASKLQKGSQQVDVEGHTDNVGLSPTLQSRWGTNWELAGARAAQVVRLLQESGLEGDRLNAISKGPFAPLASNDSEEGRRRNRRIEIRLYPQPSTTPAKLAN